MQVRNQRRTLQYPRRAVLRQMLGQGSGPQKKMMEQLAMERLANMGRLFE